MTDIFLSYSSRDRTMAGRIQGALEAAGYSVFWDQETPAGMDWNRWIGAKLAESRLAVVLWSKASVQSANILHEATIAKGRDKLVPALIEALEPEDYPMGFYTLQGADLRGFDGRPEHPGFMRLLAAVRQRLGPGRLAAPEPAAPRPTPPRPGLPRWLAPLAGLAVLGGAAAGMLALRPPPRPEPPAAEAPSANFQDPAFVAAAALQGRWAWNEAGCPAAQGVALEEGRLVFNAGAADPAQRFIHEIGSIEEGRLRTSVVAPEAFLGDIYEFTLEGDRLRFRIVGQGETYEWTRCG